MFPVLCARKKPAPASAHNGDMTIGFLDLLHRRSSSRGPASAFVYDARFGELTGGWLAAGRAAWRERDGFRAHETSTSGVSAPRASRLSSCQVSQSDTCRVCLASLSKARRQKRTVLPPGDSFQAKASGQGGADVGPNGKYLYFHCAS